MEKGRKMAAGGKRYSRRRRKAMGEDEKTGLPPEREKAP
jgi:hypothetical protein